MDCVEKREQSLAQKACIAREAFAQGRTTGKTFRCSNALRWRKPDSNEIVALMEATHGKHAPVLQQAWECIETGQVDWRDVPMETPIAEITGGDGLEDGIGTSFTVKSK